MKGQLKVATPAEYIHALDEPRRTEVTALDALIRKNAPKLQPYIQDGMLGYGPYHYKYASGREGDSCRVGLASNKNYISLYVNVTDKDGYIAERYQELLPKASIGKCCVRFKRLSDIDLKALAKLLVEAGKLAAED